MTAEERLDYTMTSLMVQLSQKLDCLLDGQDKILEVMTTKPIGKSSIDEIVNDHHLQLENCFEEVKQQFSSYGKNQQEILSLLRERLK